MTLQRLTILVDYLLDKIGLLTFLKYDQRSAFHL